MAERYRSEVAPNLKIDLFPHGGQLQIIFRRITRCVGKTKKKNRSRFLNIKRYSTGLPTGRVKPRWSGRAESGRVG